jgi:hypothetical protein
VHNHRFDDIVVESNVPWLTPVVGVPLRSVRGAESHFSHDDLGAGPEKVSRCTIQGHHSEPRGGYLDTKRMLEEVETEIAKLQRVADALRGTELAQGKPLTGRNGGHTMSAAARRKISLAQKARWPQKKEPSEEAPPKRTISAASRRKMAAAQRARWAKVKREKKAA